MTHQSFSPEQNDLLEALGVTIDLSDFTSENHTTVHKLLNSFINLQTIANDRNDTQTHLISSMNQKLAQVVAQNDSDHYVLNEGDNAEVAHDLAKVSQLQKELETLRKENAKLKSALSSVRNHGINGQSSNHYSFNSHAVKFRSGSAIPIVASINTTETSTLIEDSPILPIEKLFPPLRILEQLMDCFEENTFLHPNPIAQHADLFIELAEEVRSIVAIEKKVVELRSPIYIFGDIHGNYHDLKFYMTRFNPTGKTGWLPHKLLFLGDYVDRGDHSVEVVTRLFLDKVYARTKIFLLRGNHELMYVNSQIETYGMTSFLMQCKTLFGKRGVDVFMAFNRAFDCLPVAAIVDRELFCCHGGIPRPDFPPVPNVPLPTAFPIQNPKTFTPPSAITDSMDKSQQSSALTTSLSSRRNLRLLVDSSNSIYPQASLTPRPSSASQGIGTKTITTTRTFIADGTQSNLCPPSPSSISLSTNQLSTTNFLGVTGAPLSFTQVYHDTRLVALRELPVSLPGTMQFSSECPLLNDLLWADPAPQYYEQFDEMRRKERELKLDLAEKRRQMGIEPSDEESEEEEFVTLMDENGFCPGERGPDSIMFGSVATRNFLEANKLTMLIRGHEDQSNGMQLSQNGMVFTVFSSSNYRDANSGACLLCADKKINVVIKQSFVPRSSLPHPTNAPRHPQVLETESGPELSGVGAFVETTRLTKSGRKNGDDTFGRKVPSNVRFDDSAEYSDGAFNKVTRLHGKEKKKGKKVAKAKGRSVSSSRLIGTLSENKEEANEEERGKDDEQEESESDDHDDDQAGEEQKNNGGETDDNVKEAVDGEIPPSSAQPEPAPKRQVQFVNTLEDAPFIIGTTTSFNNTIDVEVVVKESDGQLEESVGDKASGEEGETQSLVQTFDSSASVPDDTSNTLLSTNSSFSKTDNHSIVKRVMDRIEENSKGPPLPKQSAKRTIRSFSNERIARPPVKQPPPFPHVTPRPKSRSPSSAVVPGSELAEISRTAKARSSITAVRGSRRSDGRVHREVGEEYENGNVPLLPPLIRQNSSPASKQLSVHTKQARNIVLPQINKERKAQPIIGSKKPPEKSPYGEGIKRKKF
ncbi:putative Serine/threonine-protein phosphatase [Blattamonas nauphoetae]|uniref:Serine/threonine-protein phosphatase n=1 Tax=Blattamonas nauphoetae TaxID=2049346 RepID=A0ABQ9Y191_9EUKA|nr:putative Serine/threonine-protein phosphatase [Blattamonas nauphoetae]